MRRKRPGRPLQRGRLPGCAPAICSGCGRPFFPSVERQAPCPRRSRPLPSRICIRHIPVRSPVPARTPSMLPSLQPRSALIFGTWPERLSARLRARRRAKSSRHLWAARKHRPARSAHSPARRQRHPIGSWRPRNQQQTVPPRQCAHTGRCPAHDVGAAAASASEPGRADARARRRKADRRAARLRRPCSARQAPAH